MSSHVVPKEYFYKGALMPGTFVTHELIDRAKNFKPREGDVLIAGYPRSGNNWMHYAVYLLQNSHRTITDPEDYKHSKFFIDHSLHGDVEGSDLENMKKIHDRERVFICHLYFTELQKLIADYKCKTVYMVRDPKDMLVSFYHFYQINTAFGSFKGKWDEFFELYKSNKLLFGDWTEHVSGFLNNRHQANILILRYEDVKTDTRGALAKLARFLGKEIAESKLAEIQELLNFKEMNSKELINGSYLQDVGVLTSGSFLRRGEIGEWRKWFSEEQFNLVQSRCLHLLKELGYPTDVKF